MAKILEHTFIVENENVNRNIFLSAINGKWKIVISDIDLNTERHLPMKSDEFSPDISLRRILEIYETDYLSARK